MNLLSCDFWSDVYVFDVRCFERLFLGRILSDSVSCVEV
jgi:hypothetical protein